jgi:hypothetical protein
MVRRIQTLVNTEYNVLSWNCEHVVNWALTGKAESPQLETAFWRLVFAVGLIAVVKSL